MRESKKKRLIANGWKVGSAGEFLGLSPEETAYVEMKLNLASDLRERRQRRHITQEELARVVRSSQSRIAKMEAGDPSVSLDLLLKTLLALGVSGRQIARSMVRPRRAAAA
jgi:DNA-binding XRE family transcriptional regulator